MNYAKRLLFFVPLLVVACGSDNSQPTAVAPSAVPPPTTEQPAPEPDEKQALPILPIEANLSRLVTFTKVATSIRFYYPSEATERSNWDSLMALGMYQSASADSDIAFADGMADLFEEVASEVVFNGEDAAQFTFQSGDRVALWQQEGFFRPDYTLESTYSAAITEVNMEDLTTLEHFPKETYYFADYGNLTMNMPLILLAETHKKQGEAFFDSSQWLIPGDIVNPYVCLASMATIWGLIENYWPYFDSVEVDWQAELPKLLLACEQENRNSTLQQLSSSLTLLQDNHITYGISEFTPFPGNHTIPIFVEWVEDKLVVVHKLESAPDSIAIGDELLLVDGKSAQQWVDELGPFSRKSADKRKHAVAYVYLLRREQGETIELELRDREGVINQLSLSADVPRAQIIGAGIRALVPYYEDKIKELPGNFHQVSVYKLGPDDVDEVVQSLQDSNGVILDYRHYPEQNGTLSFLGHLVASDIRSLPLFLHYTSAPSHTDTLRKSIPQSLIPLTPTLNVPAIALSSRYSQSANEHGLGYFQSAGIPIMGEPTSGINGAITRVMLFGGPEENGMSFVYTGMEVTQHDHSDHIAVGVVPDIHLPRSIESLRSGEDNQLQEALFYLQRLQER